MQSANSLTVFNPHKRLESSLKPDEEIFWIEPNVGNIDRLQRVFDRHDPAPSAVVSLMGDTHDGKSTIIASLLAQNAREHGEPREARDIADQIDRDREVFLTSPQIAVVRGGGAAEDVAQEPTTANSSFFLTRLRPEPASEPLTSILIDFEGPGGGDFIPREEAQRLLEEGGGSGEESPWEAVGMDEYDYLDTRRNSVEEHLPRLAYTFSDVVIIVTTGNLSKRDVYEKACRYAVERSLTGIENADKPALVIVNNKSTNPSTRSVRDVDLATEQFLKVHDRRGRLSGFYLDVKVMELQGFDPSRQDGREGFDSGISVLRQVLQNLVRMRRDRRAPTGLLFNNYLWTQLFLHLLREVNSNNAISIGRTLMAVCALDMDDVTQRAHRFFQAALSSCSRPVSMEDFERIRKLTLQVLAIHIGRDTQVAAELAGWSVARSAAQQEERRRVATRCFGNIKLLMHLSEPCQATTQVRDVKSRQMVTVPCTENRQSHHTHHFCSIETKKLIAQQVGSRGEGGVFRRLWHGLKGLFAPPNHKWVGSFQWNPVDDRSSDQRQAFWDMFERATSETASQERLLLSLIDAFTMIKPRSASAPLWFESFPVKCCVVCMRQDPSQWKSEFCGHRWICAECYSGLPSLNVIGENDAVSGTPLVSLIDQERIGYQYEHCPFC